MQRVTAVPYYASGAHLGLLLGYVLICVQIIQLVPGLGWLANALRVLLPETHTSSSSSSSSRPQQYSSSQASKPDAATGELGSAPGPFAVMDAGSLGSALYQMERPGSSSNSSSFPNTPHTSFQDAQPPAAAAAAAAAMLRGTAAMRGTLSPQSRTPGQVNAAVAAAAAAAQESAAAAQEVGGPLDQQQLLIALRERLNSFPIDDLSPATTATALSLLSVLAPAGHAEYSGGEGEAGAYVVGPMGAVEGRNCRCILRSVLYATANPTLPGSTQPKPALRHHHDGDA
ncbi:hypothetical protein OEZ85_014372 [Tetradesmus obliquus]|uniref:Uncharacterized protein n=1 Tax=Tetradesmus obliquus TaxID=3088 RepID=A0ABY8UA82_TETOB|nr:hypothetical protein OEZ85_014372 [Tetradesmus obliquus]